MILKSKKRYLLRIIIPAYPAFNIYSFIAKNTTALGPVSVATAVNEMERWDVEVIDENNLRRFAPKSPEGGADHIYLQQIRPADVIGLYGGLTSTIPRLYKIARLYKKKGVVTIAGGQHFCEETIPEAFSSGIDYIVQNEGEETIKDLLRILEGKKDINDVKGIIYMNDNKIVATELREPLIDFDKIPLPDYSLVRYAKLKYFQIERIRGCGMNCEFCTVKGKPRPATPERLIEHISHLVETHGANKFFIVDDLFGQQREETIRMCKLLGEYQKKINKNFKITVQIRLDKAKDTELIDAMRDAGITSVAIGFESPIEEELQAMNKKLKPHDMIALSRKYHKAGFLIHGMFIFGYPLQKEDGKFSLPLKKRIKRYKNFIKDAKIDTIQVLHPIPLPGTELRQRLLVQNRVFSLDDIGWEYYDGNFPLFNPDAPVDAQELQYAIGKIMGKFYQFKYMLVVGLNIFSFLQIIFFPHKIKLSWKRWSRHWRNNLIRFGGWITMKKWKSAFKKNLFPKKLKVAKRHMNIRGRS